MRSISKQYGPVRVLQDVEFEVRAGEIHALLGSNGAGKSTLIKILGGLVEASHGTISLDGELIDVSSPRRSLEAGIAVVHQDTELVPELTVAENIFLGLEGQSLSEPGQMFAKVNRLRLTERARQLLEDYGLGLDPVTPVRSLAPSAQQLVQIARVLALESTVVVFDEPTARLGSQDRDRLFRIFKRLRQDGKKIIFVTHYLDEVLAVADRATIMRDGRVVSTLHVPATTVGEISHLMVGDNVVTPARNSALQRGAATVQITKASSGAAFKDVSLEIAAGEIVGLVGHLGSGRHEFSRYVMARANLARGRSGGKGFVPEDRRSEAIFPQLALYENVAIGLLRQQPLFSFIPRKRMVEVTHAYIQRLQIKTSDVLQIISTLSGGNQQKAVFARALIQQPLLYIIECPTVGVDVKAGAELHAAIFEIAEQGAAILLSTDDLDEAIRLSDRIVIMRKGRVSQELQSEHFSRQALVVAMGTE
jgi:ABC-type sugar transport system ATPase subunit